MKRCGVVHIFEEEEPSFDTERQRPDGSYLCGTFGGRWTRWPRDVDGETFSGLTVDAALAWGRSRADEVQIRHGRGEYLNAGDANPSGLSEWPPPDLPPLRRRRPPEQAWRERSESDPPIEWRIEVMLAPPNGVDMTPDERWDTEQFVAEIARTSRATHWDSLLLDTHVAEAGEGEAAGAQSIALEDVWLAQQPPAFRVHLPVHASTSTVAEKRVSNRIPALPRGWWLRATAFPAR
jgi:hypothetical protein